MLLTVPQAAALLGLSRTRLYDLLASNEIKSAKIGKCRRIRPADLDAYVDRIFNNR
ncbi:MAG: helix-turn-helix domain-containing protein [Acidimicrobiales bacterium]